jgi:cytochrome b6
LNRMNRIRAFFHERLGLDVLQGLASRKRVPLHSCTPFYYLGGIALFLFLVQVVTGVLLALYYKPSPDQAFESVRTIMTEVEFGWLIRSAHSWSANLLIGVLFLHVLTTFMMRAYRRPREMTWVTGILALALFLAFGFSGYLLPWNELAFFATRVGTAIVGVVPLIGGPLLRLARGGENVTGDTLARFYALHVTILPLLTFGLMGIHLYLVQQHGMSVPNREGATHGEDDIPSMPFVPHFLLRDMVGWYLALALLAALAALFPWDLGEKANPFGSAPVGIKPEWYFLFMFQMLKQLPARIGPFEGEVLGVLFFGLAGLIVVLIPFLDRGRDSRSLLKACATVAVAFFIVMTAWGWFSAAKERGLRIMLGALLVTSVVPLLIPFTRPQSNARRLVYSSLTLAIVVFLAAIWRESLG